MGDVVELPQAPPLNPIECNECEGGQWLIYQQGIMICRNCGESYWIFEAIADDS